MALKFSGAEVKPITAKTKTVSDRETYTFTAQDGGEYLQYIGTSDSIFTVPPNSSESFSDGVIITVEQSTTGQITFDGGVGVTITSKADLMSAKEGSVVNLKRISSDNWILYGDTMDNTTMAMTIAMA